jgi:hypothetical protein
MRRNKNNETAMNTTRTKSATSGRDSKKLFDDSRETKTYHFAIIQKYHDEKKQSEDQRQDECINCEGTF